MGYRIGSDSSGNFVSGGPIRIKAGVVDARNQHGSSDPEYNSKHLEFSALWFQKNEVSAIG